MYWCCSTITLIANFSSIKILLHCFLVRILVHIYVCYDLNDIFCNFPQIFLIHNLKFIICNHSIPSLSAIISMSFLSYIFLLFINHIYIVCFTVCFTVSFLKHLFSETNSSWLIYKLIKALGIRIAIVSMFSLTTLFYGCNWNALVTW